MVAATPQKRRTWPKTIPEQVQALRGALIAAPGPLTATARPRFHRAQTKKVQELLETLVALGQVRRNQTARYSFAG